MFNLARLTLSVLFVSTSFSWACQQSGQVLIAQDAGEHVRLKAYHSSGVPLHPASGDNAVSSRLPDGTVAKVLEKDTQRDWLKIESQNTTGWITKRYVDAVVPAPPGSGGPLLLPADFSIGCWNLEHFKMGTTRGFPENTNGGPSYPGRTQHEIDALARKIVLLNVKILVLSEIAAQSVVVNGETEMRSQELDNLVTALGSQNFAYIIGLSGGTQHVAMLYDTRVVRLNGYIETDFPDQKVDGKNLFERQALIAHFAFRQGNALMNDLAIVGVHLASGQQNKNNHDLAMQKLRAKIDELRAQDLVIPRNERDVLIAGDFNANRFDTYVEKFWNEMEAADWDVLADDQATYSATRLSGVPLRPVESKIDYIIVSKGTGGLQGEEVTTTAATVHTEMIDPSDDPSYSQYEFFRHLYSDHLPVTVKVKMIPDNDN